MIPKAFRAPVTAAEKFAWANVRASIQPHFFDPHVQGGSFIPRSLKYCRDMPAGQGQTWEQYNRVLHAYWKRKREVRSEARKAKTTASCNNKGGHTEMSKKRPLANAETSGPVVAGQKRSFAEVAKPSKIQRIMSLDPSAKYKLLVYAGKTTKAYLSRHQWDKLKEAIGIHYFSRIMIEDKSHLDLNCHGSSGHMVEGSMYFKQ